jgi:hypothetical protein
MISRKKIIFTLILYLFCAVFLFLIGRWLYFLPDKTKVKEIYALFEEVQKSSDISKVYALMSPGYKQKYSLQEFQKELPTMFYGILESPEMDWKKTEAILTPGMWRGGPIIKFRKIDGQWFCDGIVDWHYD